MREREIARDSCSCVGEPRQQLSCSKEPGNARVHADSQVRAAEVDTNRECSRIHTPAQWRSNQINCNHLEQFADFVRKAKAIPERMGFLPSVFTAAIQEHEMVEQRPRCGWRRGTTVL